MADASNIERALSDMLALLRDGDVLVFNKADLTTSAAPNVSRETLQVLSISAHDDASVSLLRDSLESIITERFPIRGHAGLTRARHKACVQTCLEAVTRARISLDRAPELAGDDLRAALHAIKELAGETDIEAVLDRIFSRFCIGK